MSGIRPARTTAELDAAADLIARAFDHLDANHHLVPDPDLRLPVMRAYFALHTRHAADGAGKVMLADDGAAVAVWFDRSRQIGEPGDYPRRLRHVTGDHLPRFLELDELLEENHPADPHHHLAFLAVEPDRQGKGLGTALLQHTHAELDAAGLPAYLEATNIDNQRLYSWHGYQMMRPTRIEVSDDVDFYRMWRVPQG